MQKVAAIQMQCSNQIQENIMKADRMVKEAAENGAKIILLPELFENLYFCQERKYEHYQLAKPLYENDAVQHFINVASDLDIVLPISFYEKDINCLYNSVAVIDGDRGVLGVYRKTHIPDDHFYQEKFYFKPGDTGFKVWSTKYGRIGVGICWDQWFPETARAMAIMGADLLCYPTAIGSEPILNTDSKDHWTRVMQGHAAANITPVIAANRTGVETVLPDAANNFQESSLQFYGSSFITDELGEIQTVADRDREQILYAKLDLESIRSAREAWGLFRDRRPNCYKILSEH